MWTTTFELKLFWIMSEQNWQNNNEVFFQLCNKNYTVGSSSLVQNLLLNIIVVEMKCQILKTPLAVSLFLSRDMY